MKIKGLKKAVGEYKRANAEGYFSPRYGELMFDTSDGEIWTDEFYSIGHNDWNEYRSDTIINLGSMMTEDGIEINMKNIKDYVDRNFA